MPESAGPPVASTATTDDRKAVALAFRRAYHSLRRLRTGETNQLDGEPGNAHYELLARLDEEGPLAAGVLAERLNVKPATVSQMVDELVAVGYVERTRSDADRRLVLVGLTDLGRPWITACRGEWRQRWRAALADFSEEELATAAAVLDRIAAMIDDVHEDRNA